MRAGLRLLIESQPGLQVVGEAGNRTDALSVAAREQPDIILLDLDLSGDSALDCIPALLAAAKQARLVILTGVYDSELHRCAVHLGAMGLVLKDKAAEVLIKAIDKALSLLLEEQQLVKAMKPLKGILKGDQRPWPYL